MNRHGPPRGREDNSQYKLAAGLSLAAREREPAPAKRNRATERKIRPATSERESWERERGEREQKAPEAEKNKAIARFGTVSIVASESIACG